MVRFDKPCLRIAGAVEYFREHMVGDYLTEGGQVQMVWHGEGAARLGLSGPCRMEDFEALCAGRHPATGDKLMVLDAKSDGFELQPPNAKQIAAPNHP